MKKTEIIQQTIDNTVVTTFCDVCGNEMKFYKSTCCMCGIDLCSSCIEHEDDYGGDYPDRYCKDCWTVIGEKYRNKIDELDKEISKTWVEWEDVCMINRKQKMSNDEKK